MDAAFEKSKLDAVLFLGSLNGEPEKTSNYKKMGNLFVSKSMETAFKVDGESLILDLSHSDLHDNCPKKVWFPGFTGFRMCDQLQYSQEETMIHDKKATIYTIGRIDPKWEPPPVPPTADAPMLWTLGCSPIRIAYIHNFKEFSGELEGMAFERQLVSEFKKRKLDALVFHSDLDSVLVENHSLYQIGNAIVANSIKDTWTSQVYPVFDFLLSNMHLVRSGQLHSDWSMIGIGTRINGYETSIYTLKRNCTFWERNKLWIVLLGLSLLTGGAAGGYFLYQKRF